MSARKYKETVSEKNVRVVGALTIPHDHWLLVQNDPPKHVMGKWIAVLMGPNAKLGKWVLISGNAQSLESLWLWDMNKKTNDGAWLFYGRKPDYRDGRWMFVSERPELFYAVNGKVLGIRISTSKDGDLVVADNSEESYRALSVLNEKMSKLLVNVGPASEKTVEEKVSEVKVIEEKIPEETIAPEDRPDVFVQLKGDSKDEFQDLPVDNSLASQFRERIHQKLSESSDGGGNPLFHPVEDVKDKSTLIEQVIASKAKAEIWSKDRKHRIAGHMTSFSMNNNVLTTTVPSPEVQGFIDNLKSLNDVTCLFSVNLQQVQLFFVSSLTKFNSSAFQFEIPDKLFEVQRRYSLRYIFSPDNKVFVQFDHPNESADKLLCLVTDLSSGGLGFWAELTDKSLFAPGLELKDVSFTLGNRQISGQASIRHCSRLEINGRTGFKVGISFTKMKPRDVSFLGLFVYEQGLRIKNSRS